MDRFVFDTNVIISAILFQNSSPARVVNFAKQSGQILLSDTIFREMWDTLSRPKFDRYLSVNQRRQVLSQLLLDSQLIEITETITICRDPKDNQFLELAVSGKAHCIITGDKDLLVLNPFQGIEIMTVNEALSRFIQSSL